jgi:ketosteroid isomerase-like protein
MTSPRAVTDAFTAAYNAHQVTRAAEYYRPDVVLSTPDAGELMGREQAAEYLRASLEAFPDARVEVLVKHDSGDTTIDEWTFHGTHTGPLPLPSGETLPATGRRVSVRGVDVVTHAGGGIASHRMYFDQVQFPSALGLVPADEGTR